MKSRSIKAGALLAGLLILAAVSGCDKWPVTGGPDAGIPDLKEPPPLPVTEPSATEVDAGLRICLSGTSHHSHIGKAKSRLLHARVKRWPDKYAEALPKVYVDMLRKGQAPGSHVEFCMHLIAGGDEALEQALQKEISRVRRPGRVSK